MPKDILGQSTFTLMIKGADYMYMYIHVKQVDYTYMYIHVKQVDYTHVHVHVDHKQFSDFNGGITQQSKIQQNYLLYHFTQNQLHTLIISTFYIVKKTPKIDEMCSNIIEHY